MAMMENVNSVHAVLLDLAPTGAAQQEITTELHQLQKKGVGQKEQLKFLTNMLADGLNYGNWPWA